MKRKLNWAIRYTILLAVGLIMLYPLFWLFVSTFRDNYEIFTSISLMPSKGFGDWSAWKEGWNFATGYTILYHFGNTLKYLLPRTIFTVISSVITAYAVSRMSFKGKKVVFALIIGTLLMPDVIFRIPMYLLWRDLKMLNMFFPLYADSIFAANSFFVFMLIQFFRTIPRDLDEAATVDGCNSLRILWHILVPVLKPIIITVAVLTFMWGLNDFLGPLIYISSPEKFPLAVALRVAVDADQTVAYSKIYAMSCMALVPALVVFGLAQKYFVDGIATTGSKE